MQLFRRMLYVPGTTNIGVLYTEVCIGVTAEYRMLLHTTASINHRPFIYIFAHSQQAGRSTT